jgi:hypothetical protein
MGEEGGSEMRNSEDLPMFTKTINSLLRRQDFSEHVVETFYFAQLKGSRLLESKILVCFLSANCGGILTLVA